MSDTVTGPVPAPESTHTPGPVFRNRGVIITTLIAHIAELEAELDQAKAETAALRAQIEKVAEDWLGYHPSVLVARGLAGVALRAALAGAPAVTPTETQAGQ